MQDNNTNPNLDPWAKMGDMGNRVSDEVPSEESLARAKEWESAMGNMPAFDGDNIGEQSNDLEQEDPVGFNKQIVDAGRILNYINQAPGDPEHNIEIIKNFDAKAYENPLVELEKQLGIMKDEYSSKKDEREDLIKNEDERKYTVQRNDIMMGENAPNISKNKSHQDFYYALEQVKALISNVDGGAESKYRNLNNEALSAGMGKLNYLVRNKKKKDMATLLNELGNLQDKKEIEPDDAERQDEGDEFDKLNEENESDYE